jgi:ribosomal-protein-alanine N-acetyltransferase
MDLRRVGPFDLGVLSALHRACFAEAWDEAALASLLAMPGALALLATSHEEPLGFVILRAIAGEAEILSIGVRPQARRRGIGRRLLAAAVDVAEAAGAEQLFLEVAADNIQARGLYLGDGFSEVGRRPNYYRRIGSAITALVLSRPILSRKA